MCMWTNVTALMTSSARHSRCWRNIQPPPPPVRNLLYIVRLRALAKSAGIAAIAREEQGGGRQVLIVRAFPGGDFRARLLPSGRSRLAHVDGVTIGHEQVRLDLSEKALIDLCNNLPDRPIVDPAPRLVARPAPPSQRVRDDPHRARRVRDGGRSRDARGRRPPLPDPGRGAVRPARRRAGPSCLPRRPAARPPASRRRAGRRHRTPSAWRWPRAGSPGRRGLRTQ